MIGWVIGLGLSTTTPTTMAATSPAMMRSAPDENAPSRRSREDHRPAGRQLEMGPFATGLAMLALTAAVVARRRRTHAR